MLGRFIIDLDGLSLTAEDEKLLRHPLVGGVVLFKRNYQSRQQVTDLCQAIRATRDDYLLIMVDQEGGRVQRFGPEFTKIPPMASFGKLYDENPQYALELARNTAWLLAVEIMSVGIDLSLAPVLDVFRANSKAIGNRALHPNPNAVIDLAQSFVAGFREAGMASTGKHFPGHGSIPSDTHYTMPKDSRSLDELMDTDMLPFSHFARGGLEAILAAHVIFDQVDDKPVGYSSVWLKDILRQQMDFKGIVFSDDLNMEGANISGNYADRVKAALDAGCDFAMLCNNREGVLQVLDQLDGSSYKINQDKWGVLKADFSSVPVAFQQNKRYLQIREQLSAKTRSVMYF